MVPKLWRVKCISLARVIRADRSLRRMERTFADVL